jgi:hypothetical protein
MKKVYIVQVQGWGDDEDAMENIAAFSTRQLADAHVVQLVADALADEIEDIVTDIQVMTLDA